MLVMGLGDASPVDATSSAQEALNVTSTALAAQEQVKNNLKQMLALQSQLQQTYIRFNQQLLEWQFRIEKVATNLNIDLQSAGYGKTLNPFQALSDNQDDPNLMPLAAVYLPWYIKACDQMNYLGDSIQKIGAAVKDRKTGLIDYMDLYDRNRMREMASGQQLINMVAQDLSLPVGDPENQAGGFNPTASSASGGDPGIIAAGAAADANASLNDASVAAILMSPDLMSSMQSNVDPTTADNPILPDDPSTVIANPIDTTDIATAATIMSQSLITDGSSPTTVPSGPAVISANGFIGDFAKRAAMYGAGYFILKALFFGK